MIKIFCDECGKELKDKENKVVDRITFESKTGHKFEVICSNSKNVWNSGHLCIECVKKLINESKIKDKVKGIEG